MNNDTILQEYLYDLSDNDISLEEDIEHGERTLFWKGTFARANYKNQNNRWYPTEIMAEAYNQVKTKMNKGEMLCGYMDHPVNPEEAKRVQLEHIALTFPELTFNESTGNLYGVCKPTYTPKGEILKGLQKSGIKIGFSSRAAGKVKPGKTALGEDALIVQPGMKLLAIDAVKCPSANCFPQAITEEVTVEEAIKKYWYFNNTGKSIIEKLF
ncbi:MAG: hypothetical protein LBF97_05505 [Elusimicrobiota bacterium]|jgi:hypothetical protein|nr:hypothetical protein [Elusimicrobiota bacterium]